MNRPTIKHPTEGGEKLRKFLAIHDQTQRAFAEQMGFHVSDVNRWIRGSAVPSGDVIAVLHNECRIHPKAWKIALKKEASR